MAAVLESTAALGLLRQALDGTIRASEVELSVRQLAILLAVYLKDQPHTVRGLAAELGISKPAVTRGLDVLGRAGFIRRKRDEDDRRNIFVQRTVAGAVFLREIADRMTAVGTGQAD